MIKEKIPLDKPILFNHADQYTIKRANIATRVLRKKVSGNILYYLMHNSGKNKVDISHSIQKHLTQLGKYMKELEEIGVVTYVRKRGSTKYYSINEEALKQIISLSKQMVDINKRK